MMKKRVLFHSIALFFVISFFSSTLINLQAQEFSFRDVKETIIQDISMNDFLKLHKQGILETITNPQEEIDAEAVSIQIDYFLKQNGYSIDFLEEADLSAVDLSRVDLRFLNLKEANLEGCSLEKADLSYTNLKEANLTNAILIKANMSHSNIKEATVTDADFTGVIMVNADIHEAEGLTVKQLLTAKSLANTNLPSAIKEELEKQNPKLFKYP